jgi:hypothetical protein
MMTYQAVRSMAEGVRAEVGGICPDEVFTGVVHAFGAQFDALAREDPGCLAALRLAALSRVREVIGQLEAAEALVDDAGDAETPTQHLAWCLLAKPYFLRKYAAARASRDRGPTVLGGLIRLGPDGPEFVKAEDMGIDPNSEDQRDDDED